MSNQNQTIEERYGAPPPLESLQGKKAKLCEKCKEHGSTVYFFWGDTGQPKKNDPTKNIVLPVEITTGKWHECPYREAYNPQGNGTSYTPQSQPPTTQGFRPQPSNQPLPVHIQEQAQHSQTFYQTIIEQNKQLIQYTQSILAAVNHVSEYAEIIANGMKTGPTRVPTVATDDFGTGVTVPMEEQFDTASQGGGQRIELDNDKLRAKQLEEERAKQLQEEDAKIEKEYLEYKEKFNK